MSSKAIVLFLISVCSLPALAQSDTTASHEAWFVSLHSGALLGKLGNASSVSATLMQGVRFNRLGILVGTGYDCYYQWRTLPIFGGVSYDITARNGRAFFIQLNAGYSKAWSSIPDEELVFNYSQERGYFYHPFVGYRVRHGDVEIYFSAGYKFQNLHYQQIPRWSSWGGTRSTIDQDMERLSVQMGIGL